MKGMTNIFMILFCASIIISACGTEPNVDAESKGVVAETQPVKKEDFPDKVINPIPANKTEKEISEIPKAKLTETKEIVKEDVKKAVAKASKEAEKKITTKKVVKKKKPSKKKRAKIKFDNEVFEFGTIKPGDVINHKFNFTNTGEADLVIKAADVTCGCTYPSYPFVPIPPGEKGFIEVTYDSKGKLGKQIPTVTLTTNAGTKKISMQGYVISEMAKEE